MIGRIFVFLAALVNMSFGLVSPELKRHVATAAPDALLPVHVVMKEQFDPSLLNSLVAGMPRAARRAEVARILRDFSDGQQSDLLQFLAAGNARKVTPLWIVNAVCCEATPDVIRQVSERPDVAYVGYDLAYAPGELEEPGEPAPPTAEIPWGVERINAPAVWALGHTGQGIVVGIIDTGCNYNHPDFADHLWTDVNYPHHGWDFENNDNDPMDDNGHGTYTAGCVASDGTSGSQCGAAPDAQLMFCRVRTTADSISESQCWQAMEFCVAPPLSPASGADLYVTTLGWMMAWQPHQAVWRTAVDNVQAAGLSQVFSAGADGSGNPPYNLRCPGHVPPPWWNPENTGTGALSGGITAGATDESDNLASFSGQGPVTWQGIAPFDDYAYPPGLTKPEFCAPGVNIKTCALGGGYTTVSGTSWSCGFVGGAVALLLSADSSLTPAGIDSLLEVSAVDLGPSGKDNAYGAGRIDVLAAVTGVAEARPTLQARRMTPVAVPNPFRQACRVSRPGAEVEVLDALGRRVAVLSGGVWQPGPEVEPGVYHLRTATGETVRVTYIR